MTLLFWILVTVGLLVAVFLITIFVNLLYFHWKKPLIKKWALEILSKHNSWMAGLEIIREIRSHHKLNTHGIIYTYLNELVAEGRIEFETTTGMRADGTSRIVRRFRILDKQL